MKHVIGLIAVGFCLASIDVALAQTDYDRRQDETIEEISTEQFLSSRYNEGVVDVSLDIPIGTGASSTTQLIEFAFTGNAECKLVGLERVGDGHSDCVIGYSSGSVPCSRTETGIIGSGRSINVDGQPFVGICRRAGVVMRRYVSSRANGEKREVGGRCHVRCTSSLIDNGRGDGISSHVATYPIQRTGQ